MEVTLSREQMQDAINEVAAGDKTFASLQTLLESRGVSTEEFFHLMKDIYSYDNVANFE